MEITLISQKSEERSKTFFSFLAIMFQLIRTSELWLLLLNWEYILFNTGGLIEDSFSKHGMLDGDRK